MDVQSAESAPLPADVASAGDPDITATEWLRLADLANPTLDHILLANHPAKNAKGVSAEEYEHFFRLVSSEDIEIRTRAVMHLPLTPVLEDLEMTRVVQRLGSALPLPVALNPALSHSTRNTLYKMTNIAGTNVRVLIVALAANPSTSERLLAKMANDTRFEVREALWSVRKNDPRVIALLSEEFA